MLSVQLEEFLQHTSAGSITELFIWLIIAIFISSFMYALLYGKSKFIGYAPTLMTSLGILGTFVGIVIGLLGFDSHNINESIPQLLDGLKTAFITSICGLVGAIFFNFLDSIFFQGKQGILRKNIESESDSITPEDIYSCLNEQKEILHKVVEIQEKSYLGISGSEEGSLVGQLKMLRADISPIAQQSALLKSLNGNFIKFSEYYAGRQKQFEDKLFIELSNFADMLSKSATEQIIEALKVVIEDFNKNLTEQFGENFKALDESVKKLVTWQAQYKEQVETMAEQYQQSVESLVETKNAVGGIWAECENIPTAMNDLKEIMTVNQHQISELNRHLEVFGAMRDAAIDAVPQIHEQIEYVGSQLVSASDEVKERLLTVSEKLLSGSVEIQEALEEGSQNFRDSVAVTQQSFNELAHTVKESSEDLSNNLKEASSDLYSNIRQISTDMSNVVNDFNKSCNDIMNASSQQVESLANELQKTFIQSRDTYEKHMNDTAEKTGQIVNTQLEQLEKATAREIQKAMQEMGNALVQITGRFVQDYERMVKDMDKVIHSKM